MSAPDEGARRSRLILSAYDLLKFAERVEEACSFPEDDFQRVMRDEARRVIAKATKAEG